MCKLLGWNIAEDCIEFVEFVAVLLCFVCFGFGRIAIFRILIVLTHERRRSFHLQAPFTISFFNDLKFFFTQDFSLII